MGRRWFDSTSAAVYALRNGETPRFFDFITIDRLGFQSFRSTALRVLAVACFLRDAKNRFFDCNCLRHLGSDGGPWTPNRGNAREDNRLMTTGSGEALNPCDPLFVNADLGAHARRQPLLTTSQYAPEPAKPRRRTRERAS